MMKKRAIIISIIGGIIFGIILSLYIVPFITKKVSTWGNSEFLTLVTIIGVIVAVSVPFLDDYLERKRTLNEKQALYQIDINVTTLPNNFVRFSAFIKNVGEKTIEVKVANLYIDQGVPIEKGSEISVNGKDEPGAIYYEFPFILQHKEYVNGRPDCILCTKCKNNDLNYPTDSIIDRFKQKSSKLYRTNIELEHLSDKSIKYINPKEQFSEDVILQFKCGGVYRVTFIVTTNGEADCECATKQFYIA